MEYLSKSYRLDEEVIAWLERLRELHGSVNKGLRLVAFARDSTGERVQMTPGEERFPKGVPQRDRDDIPRRARPLREKGDQKR